VKFVARASRRERVTAADSSPTLRDFDRSALDEVEVVVAPVLPVLRTYFGALMIERSIELVQ
jgi:hypothetical protein